ncbi:hypothetical protein NDU88_000082 [Pleurodeles waltl]|uniref:Uncharacterized protein n=1 Tax=Pleurodeles waltl TaxID=8319 RepID=A0AAV7L952_PLEWA|nr:hypothetical protein NDU88_000082 [Pleurodeles waltl]
MVNTHCPKALRRAHAWGEESRWPAGFTTGAWCTPVLPARQCSISVDGDLLCTPQVIVDSYCPKALRRAHAGGEESRWPAGFTTRAWCTPVLPAHQCSISVDGGLLCTPQVIVDSYCPKALRRAHAGGEESRWPAGFTTRAWCTPVLPAHQCSISVDGGLLCAPQVMVNSHCPKVLRRAHAWGEESRWPAGFTTGAWCTPVLPARQCSISVDGGLVCTTSDGEHSVLQGATKNPCRGEESIWPPEPGAQLCFLLVSAASPWMEASCVHHK